MRCQSNYPKFHPHILYSRHTNMTSAMIGRKSPSSWLIGQLGIATYLSFVYVVFPLGRFVSSIIWVFLRFKWILTGCITMPVKVLTYDSSKHQHDRLEEGEGVKNAWKWSWLGWQVGTKQDPSSTVNLQWQNRGTVQQMWKPIAICTILRILTEELDVIRWRISVFQKFFKHYNYC